MNWLRWISITAALCAATAGCTLSAEEEDVGERAAAAVTTSVGTSGRDGYIEARRLSRDSSVDRDHQFGFVLRNRDGSPKESLAPGDQVTALIPDDVARDLGEGGRLSGTLDLFYNAKGREKRRDHRAMTPESTGSFTATSFTVPDGVDELSPRLSMITTAKIRGQQISIVPRAWGTTIPVRPR